MLKEYRNMPWPQNLWSAVFRKEVSEKELPEDWEQALKYIFDARIDDKKANILLHYFQDGMTLQEIGDICGLTMETIRQHASKAIRTMRHPAWRVFLIYGLEKGKAVIAEERAVAERQRLDDRTAVAAGCRIETLDLSVRTFNCLKRAGISTVDQLTKCSDEELARMRNMGAKSLQEIKDCLATIRGEGEEKATGEREATDDLISRGALMEAVEDIDWYSENQNLGLHEGARNEEVAFVRYADVEAVIKAVPVAQVAPVVHGRWIERREIPSYSNKNIPVVECSKCRIIFCDIINNHNFMYHYCPYCGAKMEGALNEG